MDLVVFEKNKPYIIDEFREGRFDYIELASDVAETKFFQFLFSKLHFRGSCGEGKQVLEERPQFAVVGADRQSGQEFFSQHFSGN